MKLDLYIDPDKLTRGLVGGFYCFGVLIFAIVVIFAIAQ